MQVENREDYKNVPISLLNFSNRTFNALMRAKIDTLYLLIENLDKLSGIQNLGNKSISEIEAVLASIEDTDFSIVEQPNVEKEQILLSKEILCRPITDLRISNRVFHALEIAGIDTIGQVCSLNETEIAHMKNMGTLSSKQLIEEIEAIFSMGEAYFSHTVVESDDDSKDDIVKREFDIHTIKKLQEAYGFKTILLCDWYGISRQRVYQKLENRINRGNWLGKELLKYERETITGMINSKRYYQQDGQTKYYLLNNMQDDCAFLVVSEEDIKCFFLEDLPEALQARVKSENLHRFSETETAALSVLGRKVSILKKQYFMPEDSNRFRTLASARNMSNEEYSQFLFKVPYCSAQSSVTDDKIIEFLKENTVEGRTFISSTPDTQWMRSFISRNGFSINDFIRFYGFNTETKEDAASFEFDVNDTDTVEKDMQVYSNEGGYVEKLYAETPLLGSRIISQKNIDIINKNSRNFLIKLLNDPGAKPSLKAEMQITLAVINYAKAWDTEDEAGFWKFITAQFGYRDDSGQLRSLLCKCIKDSLLKNNRWFITNSSGNMYKSSIMVHAFSTKRSWLHFCDFLFDFYKTNLEWEYIENDPMFARMIYALRNKFKTGDDERDEDIEISTKIYYFREGIVKLILQRPRYATQLVECIIRRLDALINHSADRATCYEETLCDEWMEQKIQGFSIKKQREPSVEKRVIAIDYTRIKPVYRLYNERDIRIVFPDVRLEKNDFNSLYLSIYHEGSIVEKKSLSFYGNELGKTMSGFSIELEEYLRKSGAATFAPQIVISCDSEEIYNSGRSLIRKILVFKDKTEVDASSCEKGGYSVFAPRGITVEYDQASVSPVKENAYYTGSYVEFEKDFTLNVEGDLVAYDNTNGEELRVVVPNSKHNADYVVDGCRYRIMSGTETIHLISPDREIEKKYQVAINDEILHLDQLPYEETGASRIYKIEIGRQGTEELSLRVLDFASNRLIVRRYFKIIPSFNYRFNRLFYFLDEDYREARLCVAFADSVFREYPITKEDSKIAVPYQNGEIEIAVPRVKFIDNRNEEWAGSRFLWKNDIPQERFLYAKLPSGVNAYVLLDGKYVGTEDSNSFAIGNSVAGYSNIEGKKCLRIYAVISAGKEEKQYDLGKIALQEQFVETPKLSIKDDVLFWNRGYGFIGDRKAAFKVKIGTGTPYETILPLDLDEEKIAENVQLPLGEYQYSIVKQSGNLFSMQLQEMAEGNFFVGDEHELRFLKHFIQIDTITFEEDDTYDAVKIKTCYIDHIEYKGIHYVGSEDRECPVYNGILFFISPSGKRHEYSYQDKKDEYGHQLYQINPVRIVYINETTLSITQETGELDEPGDGFYYYRYFDKYEMKNIYQLTDWEPTRFNQDKYYLADLYSYTRKEGKGNV